MLDPKRGRLGVDYSLEDRLLRALSDRTARIQEKSDTEARLAIAGISGPDLWPEKKRLIGRMQSATGQTRSPLRTTALMVRTDQS